MNDSDTQQSPPSSSRSPEDTGLLHLAILAVQLLLVLLVLYLYRIEESAGLLRIAPLILAGFVIHALVPMRYRIFVFLALSFGCIYIILGLKQSFGLVGLGLVLLGICHLPFKLWLRLGILFAVVAFLALVRAGRIETFWEDLRTPVLPLLSIMFMFRLAVYLYDNEHSKEPVSAAKRVGYFFLLPSTCFPLFPVIDFSTYRRTYYNKPALQIYLKGIHWMLRGTIHLILYRVVYHYLVPIPEEVQGLGGTVQFALSSYLLYLRVSGLFHLITGMLALFGFNLPLTNNHYYFSSSFTDFWRRINIYWKDFMMKLLYYPLFMRLRKYGMGTARTRYSGCRAVYP